ncbi:uncharacterized protein ACA1_017320 [Acanthamoeba castellanii str. Neff]|uniref:MICOS complex subunit MIC10 n=1 Tax=Acanthamoeba castellanii (strain ATCC 30010 / Neff) TaxID=1257118 RepID=L8HGV8_ACACF|nr:uncharacterized protein ACA1_017320 [Acanthamoeba castellanii str. Neff]ELR24405.1 hypothetical protein ACA1_017320 [Acanthamoeba castellanii str. Neff]
MAEQQVQRSLPRELDAGVKLDRAIERFLIYTPIGATVGLGLSFLFQRRFLKATVFGFSTGTAFGMAWGDSKWDCAHPSALHGQRLWRATATKQSSPRE